MKKSIAFVTTLVLICTLFAGCCGTPVVYYTECTCPAGSHDVPAATEAPAETQTPVIPLPDPSVGPVAYEGGLKTGLAVLAKLDGSASATADAEGIAKYDVTLVAVTVDDQGLIVDCVIDSIGTQVNFDATGALVTDTAAEVLTKNELGDAYGMGAISVLGLEWNEQAAGLAEYAEGKTVEQLKTVAINESGYAVDADLVSTASINLFSYIYGIEAAVNNAQHLGAQAGDELRLASISTLGDSAAATAEKAGNAQLTVDVTAVTMNGDKITSCVIDSLQAKVAFDTTGAITSDLAAPQTKNQLGTAYGMSAISSIGKDWNEQAAAFAEYVKGMTAEEVAGIQINEATKPVDVDLASSVTISIYGFLALIAKVCA